MSVSPGRVRSPLPRSRPQRFQLFQHPAWRLGGARRRRRPPPSRPSTAGSPGSPRRSTRPTGPAAASRRSVSICRGTASAARCVSSRSASRGGPLPWSPPVQNAGVRSPPAKMADVRPQHEPGEVRSGRLLGGGQERRAGPRTRPGPAAASASSRRSAPSPAPPRIHRCGEERLQAFQDHRPRCRSATGRTPGASARPAGEVAGRDQPAERVAPERVLRRQRLRARPASAAGRRTPARRTVRRPAVSSVGRGVPRRPSSRSASRRSSQIRNVERRVRRTPASARRAGSAPRPARRPAGSPAGTARRRHPPARTR